MLNSLTILFITAKNVILNNTSAAKLKLRKLTSITVADKVIVKNKVEAILRKSNCGNLGLNKLTP
jgi:hypothetical protein